MKPEFKVTSVTNENKIVIILDLTPKEKTK